MAKLSFATVASLALLTACADFGPFRATGESSSDAGSSGDGGGGDAATDGPLPDGASVPVRLATDTGDPYDLIAVGSYLYWAAGDEIHRVAIAGGSVQELAAGNVNRLTSGGGKLAWTTTPGVSKSENFATPVPLASATGQAKSIAASDTDVFYVTGDTQNRQIMRVGWAGGTPTPIATSEATLPEVVVGGTNVYWTTYATNAYELRRAPLSSPTTSTPLTTSSTMVNLAASGSVVCWVEQPNPNESAYDIWCWRNNGRVRVARARYQIFNLAVTDTAVFYAARADSLDAHIFRYNFATQATTQHDTSGPPWVPYSIAVDGTYLYSVEANEPAREIWRQPLP